MIKYATSLVLVGAGFAGGLALILSCTSAHKASLGESGQKVLMSSVQPTLATALKDDEQVITFAQLPEVVRTAALKLTTEKDVKKVERATADGRTTFEIDYVAEGEERACNLTDKGVVLELERPAKELPDAVKEAIAKSMPDSKIGESQSVQLFYYEVVVSKDKKKHEVKVFANGEFVGGEED